MPRPRKAASRCSMVATLARMPSPMIVQSSVRVTRDQCAAISRGAWPGRPVRQKHYAGIGFGRMKNDGDGSIRMDAEAGQDRRIPERRLSPQIHSLCPLVNAAERPDVFGVRPRLPSRLATLRHNSLTTRTLRRPPRRAKSSFLNALLHFRAPALAAATRAIEMAMAAPSLRMPNKEILSGAPAMTIGSARLPPQERGDFELIVLDRARRVDHPALRIERLLAVPARMRAALAIFGMNRIGLRRTAGRRLLQRHFRAALHAWLRPQARPGGSCRRRRAFRARSAASPHARARRPARRAGRGFASGPAAADPRSAACAAGASQAFPAPAG